MNKQCKICGTIIPYGGKTDLCTACRTERNRKRMLERYSALIAAAKSNRLCEMCGAPTNGIRGYLCAASRQKQMQNGAKNEGEAFCPSLLLYQIRSRCRILLVQSLAVVDDQHTQQVARQVHAAVRFGLDRAVPDELVHRRASPRGHVGGFLVDNHIVVLHQ